MHLLGGRELDPEALAQVKGVPRISVEEALWTAAETLETPA